MTVNFDTMPTENTYTGLVIVSPMMFGEDEKDQDRARWFGPGQIGCVCDGVTSSPNSAEAAELVTSFVPMLFEEDSLKMVCNLLMARRQEFQQSELVTPDGTTPGMQDLLKKVIQEKRSISFQTTVVATKLVCQQKAVLAYIMRCGDSAFFAFSGEGEPLSLSLTYPLNPGKASKAANKRTNPGCLSYKMSFGPGDQILVRVEGPLSEYKNLARRAGIKNEHMRNWLVCTPIDVCGRYEHSLGSGPLGMRRLSLRQADQLLIPKYLYGSQLDSNGQRYRVLEYSSTIRLLSAAGTSASLSRIIQHGSTTEVLPDHFYCGCVEYYQDRFPPGSGFVLCSDGLYSIFSDARRLWAWVQENANALSHEDERQSVLKRLHSKLNDKGGDDDISFVLVYPRDSAVIRSEDVKAVDR